MNISPNRCIGYASRGNRNDRLIRKQVWPWNVLTSNNESKNVFAVSKPLLPLRNDELEELTNGNSL